LIHHFPAWEIVCQIAPWQPASHQSAQGIKHFAQIIFVLRRVFAISLALRLLSKSNTKPRRTILHRSRHWDNSCGPSRQFIKVYNTLYK
jgi:hypothetical protein